MTKYIQKAGQMLAFVPLLTMPNAQLAYNIGQLPSKPITKVEISVDDIRRERAEAIDTLFKKRSAPLEGKGMTFVLVAEKYGLDWRLLPAISIRESSGGKEACGYNAFGWGSCKLASRFSGYDEAINAIGYNLGGANPNTSKYYAGKTTTEKLYAYNGSVEPPYIGEVLAIMKMFGDQ